jgi:hypothetical protein
MKKHILGIVIFSFIVTTAFLLTVRLIPKSDIMSTIATNEDISDVDLNDLTFDIVSAKYDSEKNQVTQELRFVWKGKGNPPKAIVVNSDFSSSSGQYRLGDNRNSKVQLLFSRVMVADVLLVYSFSADSDQNYYVETWLGRQLLGASKPKNETVIKSSAILFKH